MPAPLFERVADKLGLPADRSEKLVRAMIREIRKRANQGQGVRVPNLGSFSVEDGRLTFHPEPSLARSVNQRFEGLAEETVALPEVEESAQTGEGPTTITRGFDMGAWDPLDTGGASSNSGRSPSSNGGADTDEFQAPPDTDEFQAPPDTDEFEAPDTGESDAAAEGAVAEGEASGSDASKQERGSTGTERSSNGDSGQTSWDVGGARPVSGASADVSSGENLSGEETSGDARPEGSSDDSFSPSRFRGEEPSEIDEPDFDASAPPQVSDHRPSDPMDDDPHDGTGFRTASGDTEGDSSQDTSDRDTSDRDTPSEMSASDRGERDDDEDDEPNIWSSESAWDFSTVTSEDVEDDDEFDLDDGDDASSMSKDEDTSDDKEPEYVSYRPPDADEQAADERPARSIFDFDSEAAQEKKEAPKTTKLDASEIQNLDQDRTQQESKQGAGGEDGSSGSRSAATTVTVVVLVVLAMMGGWIVLGHQGIVPPPSRTLGLSDGLTEPADPDATGGDESTSTSDATGDDTGDATGEPSDEDVATTSTTPSEGDDAASPSATDSGADDGASTASRGFDRSAGGFTIAVASRETESQARALVDQFRRNLSDTNLRIDIVVGESGGTTRYRVGVGQFSTRAEANSMRNEMQGRLPDGAWPVAIE